MLGRRDEFRLSRRLAEIGLVVAVAVASFAVPALAVTNGWRAYDPNEGSLSTVTMEKCWLTSAVSSAQTWSKSNNVSPLDVNPLVYGCQYPVYYKYEIVVYDYDYGDTGWAGRWTCVNKQYVSGIDNCKAAKIQIHTDHINGSNTNYDKAVLCHEHGHALGLAHNGGSTCMTNPATSSNKYYKSSEKSELNGIY